MERTKRIEWTARQALVYLRYQQACRCGGDGIQMSEAALLQRLEEALDEPPRGSIRGNASDLQVHTLDDLVAPYASAESIEPPMRWISATGKYPRLKMAARVIAHRLGGNAYFVGSALHSLTRPRDVDVRVVLPDEVFTARYGITPQNWQWETAICDWSAAHWKWYSEEDRCRIMLSQACGERTTDLSVIPEMLWHQVYQRPGEEAPCEAWGSWEPDPTVLASYKAHQENVTDPLGEAESYLTWYDAFLDEGDFLAEGDEESKETDSEEGNS